MPQWSDYSTGQRIKLLRGRDITQAQLAEMTGLSLPTIRAAEQDKALTLPTLMKIAAALSSDTSTILGQRDPAGGSAPSERAMLRSLSHTVHDALTGSSGHGIEPVSVPDLDATLTRAWQLYGTAEYTELGAMLGPLLQTAHASVTAANLDDRTALIGALSDAYQVTAHVSCQLGARDLAYTAISLARTHAEAAGDPLRTARVDAARSWVYRRDNRPAESLALVEAAAASVEPSYSTATIEHLTVYGSLVNHGAVAASRCAAGGRAADFLSQAHAVGARLGAERRVHGGTFGPATAAVKAVDVNLAIGEVGKALTLIKTMPRLDELAPVVRHRYALDVALAQCRARQWDASLDTLEAVCAAAPHWARHQTVPRLILQQVGAQSTARLRRVAALVGVTAVPRG